MSFRIEEHNEVSQVTTYQDTSLGIMRWGKSNSYPKTLENLIKQSPSAYPAVKRTAKFYKGSGFEGEDEIVNQSGLTLGGAVSIIADDYALFGAFAIQCNYNIKGEVTSINPLRISDLRFSEFDELNYANKIGYFFDFGRNSEVKKSITQTATKNKIKWFNRFNPKASLSQIEATEDGINNYLGQVLYYSDEGFNSYPTPPLQPAINFVLSDIENSILVRKETSTGFINSYLYKTTLSSTDPIHLATMGALEEAQGARGVGKITAITGLAPEDLTNTLLEPIDGGSSNSIINSAKTTYELNREVINGTYLIPPALAGIDQKSGFSGADLEEAYSVYNAITQNSRDTIESEINKILKVSTFDVKEIKISKLVLNSIDDLQGEEDAIDAGVSQEQLEAQARLRGSVGGVQGILGIQASVSQGITSPESAIETLREIYGFKRDTAIKILGVSKEMGAPEPPVQEPVKPIEPLKTQ